MNYFINFNKEKARVEIVVLNHKGKHEVTIHGDDVLKVTVNNKNYPVSSIYNMLDEDIFIALDKEDVIIEAENSENVPEGNINVEGLKQDENSSRDNADVNTERA